MKEQTNSEDYVILLKNRESKIKFYDRARKYFAQPFIKRHFNVHITGDKKIPGDNSCIFVTHHCLYFDSILLGAIFDKKIHGWIAENVFSKRKKLYERLELIPIKTGGDENRENRKELMDSYKKTVDLSLFWLKHTFDAVATTNDGLAECCLDQAGNVISLENRKNYSGAVNLAYGSNQGSEKDILVFPISCWIPEEHRRELLIAKGKWGWRGLLYLEKQRKIPCRIYVSEGLSPKNYDHKKKFQDEIRRRQVEGYNILENITKS